MDYEKLHKDTINKLQQMVNSGKITVETACGICADFVPECEDEVKAQELKGTLKSHPIEHLQDEGVWNDKDMAFLFLHHLQKTLIGYSQADRKFIGDVGRLVYQWTVSDLCRRAFIKIKKGGQAWVWNVLCGNSARGTRME